MDQIEVAPRAGFEPATNRLTAICSVDIRMGVERPGAGCGRAPGNKTVDHVNGDARHELGLQKRVSGEPDRVGDPLGRELDVKLLMVFAGLWDDSEVPMLLEEHGLISEEQQYEIYARYWGKDTSEAILLLFVRRAFFEFFKTNAIVS
jgi:hypothetical protein